MIWLVVFTSREIGRVFSGECTISLAKGAIQGGVKIVENIEVEEPFAGHMHRLKGITRDDVVKFVNGPEAFTPDNNFIMGKSHLTEGFFVSGGWNSAGIACAGGVGKHTVEWIQNGGMIMDLTSVNILRFIPFQNSRAYLQERFTIKWHDWGVKWKLLEISGLAHSITSIKRITLVFFTIKL